MSIAKIVVSLCFSILVSQFLGDMIMFHVVLYSLFKITQTLISNAKVAICTTLSSFVSQFFGNAKILLVVF